MILAVTSALPNLKPTIGFDQRQEFFDLRRHGRSISQLRNWSVYRELCRVALRSPGVVEEEGESGGRGGIDPPSCGVLEWTRDAAESYAEIRADLKIENWMSW